MCLRGNVCSMFRFHTDPSVLHFYGGRGFEISSSFRAEALRLPDKDQRGPIIYFSKKVKWSLYMPGVAQRVGRHIALLFHDRGTRRGWVVSSTPWLHFTPGKDPVPILQEAGWASGPVWTGGKSRHHRDSIPDHPARSQSLYRLRYPAHNLFLQSWKYIWAVNCVRLGSKTNLTNYMGQSRPWKAVTSSTSQEIPRILWNLKVH